MFTLDDMQLLQTQSTKTANHFLGDITKQELSSVRNRTKYAYVGNDPVNGIDPSGLTCETKTGSRLCDQTDDSVINVFFGPPGIDATPEESLRVGRMAEAVSLGDAGVFDTLVNCPAFDLCIMRLEEIEEAFEDAISELSESDNNKDNKKKPRRPKPPIIVILQKVLGKVGNVMACDIANRPSCDGPGGARPSRERTDAILDAIEAAKIIGSMGQSTRDESD